MEIGKYIHKLLLENESVIIPGFGAFVSNYKPAELIKETNELKPPSKEISFSQQIRNNDGLLVGCIADGENISHFDALKKIEKERENIIFKLDKREKVSLEETGELFFDENNEIQFNPFEDENLLLDSFGLEPLLVNNLVEKKKEAETKSNTETHEILEPEKENSGPKIIPVLEKETKKSEATEQKPAYAQVNKNEERKKRSWLWILLIMTPIFLVGILIINQKSSVEKPPESNINEPHLPIQEEQFPIADSIVDDSIAKEEIVIDSTKIGTVNLPRFYLVGGSFKEEKNAEKYMLQLSEKGFEPFQLGKRGNFYIIGIGAYKTELEALEAKRDFVKNNPNSGVWIMNEE